ncbi:MAG: hypothetical protein ACD_46C00351G0002 [uncultured bacterium]|nr:MAG: hypothetical protein ACD_46C00351G0002 [uncultured bacterium]
MSKSRAKQQQLTSKEFTIKDLPNLVKDNNFLKIKEIFENAKSKNEINWKMADLLSVAVRDAILQEKNDILQYFLENGCSKFLGQKIFDVTNDYQTYSLLYFAVKIANLPAVKLLIDHGAPIGSGDQTNNDLGVAIEYGHTDIVRYLLKKGAKASSDLLGRAAINGYKKIVSLLVKYGADVGNAIALACDSIHFRVSEKMKFQRLVNIVLDHGFGANLDNEGTASFKEREVDLSGVNFVGVSFNGKPVTREMLQALGATGADKALITRSDIEQLPDSPRKNNLLKRLDKSIKQNGKLIDANGIINLTPIWCAIDNNDVQAVKIKLEAGIDPNTWSTDFWAIKNGLLYKAVRNGNPEMVKLFINHPKINLESVISAIKALSEQANNKEIRNILLQNKIHDVNTLLHHAIKNLLLENVKILIDAETDVEKNINGLTALDVANEMRKANPTICLDPEFQEIVKELENAAKNKGPNKKSELVRQHEQMLQNKNQTNKNADEHRDVDNTRSYRF